MGIVCRPSSDPRLNRTGTTLESCRGGASFGEFGMAQPDQVGEPEPDSREGLLLRKAELEQQIDRIRAGHACQIRTIEPGRGLY